MFSRFGLPMTELSNLDQSLWTIGGRSDYFNSHVDQVDEAHVRLLVPHLLKLLGVGDQDFVPEYRCDQQIRGKVDFAAKFSREEETVDFFGLAKDPDLIIEVKNLQ